MFWQSDLASWMAVVIGGVLVYLAYRVLRPTSYIEFIKDWKVEIKDAVVIVTGRIISITPSAYISGVGSTLKIKKNTIPLYLKSADYHQLLKNTQVLVFEGEYSGSILPKEGIDGMLKLKVQLSDRKTKGFKANVHIVGG